MVLSFFLWEYRSVDKLRFLGVRSRTEGVDNLILVQILGETFLKSIVPYRSNK